MNTTPTYELKLNPDLDPAQFAAIYKRDGIVQIPNILAEDTAKGLLDVLVNGTPWRLAFPKPSATPGGRDEIVYLNRDEIDKMGMEAAKAEIDGVLLRARQNYGYMYNVYPMVEAYTNGWDQGHPLHTVTEFLNSRGFLEFGRTVIGADRITKADASATQFAPGHFLTRHIDEGYDRERRAAYTLGMTPGWQTDWGGLLMFLDDNQDIERAYMPRFNVLTLFDGTRIHSVSQVAGFAGGGRVSITGWLRDDPPVTNH
ncbi:2OG-Fe(II) oxygenase family protein [Maricaulis sp.]|uniref:2OG-Fe(II) oxygenase n=1 Tax=Maricaulis sp. TaxID=1486257 RepID=UPI00260D29AF|nr:2OG-Fe(II) oxygenase family protein [Maricaulis sp.]